MRFLYCTLIVLTSLGCAPPPEVTSEKKVLTAEQFTELEPLLDAFYERSAVGRKRSEFSRLFELANHRQHYRNGREGYGFHLPLSGGEAGPAVEWYGALYIVTDGGSPSNGDSPSCRDETILEVHRGAPGVN